MTFLAPLAFALLALLPPIIALYFLKLRRREQVVSSTYLWRRFVRDVEANAPWQRLRRNLLLLLQLAFMLALILALSRPATPDDGVAGRLTLLILDTSASMQATDVPGGDSRLQAARSAAQDLVVNLPDNARVTVIAAAGGEVELLVSASQNRRQVLAAIDRAAPTALNSDLGPALAMAEAIVAREPQAEIVLLSDGVIQTPPVSAPLRLLTFGQVGDNQAISLISITPAARGEPALFAQLQNHSPRPIIRRLVIEADGQPINALDVALPANGSATVGGGGNPIPLPAGTELVSVHLTPDPGDSLALDDRGWLPIRSAEPPAVTLVTPGNFFLQTALSLVNAQSGGLALTVESPPYTPTNPSTTPGLHIFDGNVPESLPPGNLLFIAPPESVLGLFTVAGQTQAPALLPQTGGHDLLQAVDLAETQILTTTVIQPAAWAKPLLNADLPESNVSIPLLLAGEIDGRRVVVLAFDLHQSDLPLRPSFPILVANVIAYLGPNAASLIPTQIPPGESLTLSLPPEVTQIRLTRPDGTSETVEPTQNHFILSSPREPGPYTLTLAEAIPEKSQTVQVAVNFNDPLESAIAPQPDRLAESTPRPATGGMIGPPAHREWWRPLGFAALALLLIEWLVYRRGVLRARWHQLRRWAA